MPGSHWWCVDKQSNFATKTPFKIYRVQLPFLTDEDKTKVEGFKAILKEKVQYETIPCPFEGEASIGASQNEKSPKQPRRLIGTNKGANPQAQDGRVHRSQGRRWRYSMSGREDTSELSDEDIALDIQDVDGEILSDDGERRGRGSMSPVRPISVMSNGQVDLLQSPLLETKAEGLLRPHTDAGVEPREERDLYEGNILTMDIATSTPTLKTAVKTSQDAPLSDLASVDRSSKNAQPNSLSPGLPIKDHVQQPRLTTFVQSTTPDSNITTSPFLDPTVVAGTVSLEGSNDDATSALPAVKRQSASMPEVVPRATSLKKPLQDSQSRRPYSSFDDPNDIPTFGLVSQALGILLGPPSGLVSALMGLLQRMGSYVLTPAGNIGDPVEPSEARSTRNLLPRATSKMPGHWRGDSEDEMEDSDNEAQEHDDYGVPLGNGKAARMGRQQWGGFRDDKTSTVASGRETESARRRGMDGRTS